MRMVYVVVLAAVLHTLGAGYLGYKYGRKVEAKAQAALAAVAAVSQSVRKAV